MDVGVKRRTGLFSSSWDSATKLTIILWIYLISLCFFPKNKCVVISSIYNERLMCTVDFSCWFHFLFLIRISHCLQTAGEVSVSHLSVSKVRPVTHTCKTPSTDMNWESRDRDTSSHCLSCIFIQKDTTVMTKVCPCGGEGWGHFHHTGKHQYKVGNTISHLHFV